MTLSTLQFLSRVGTLGALLLVVAFPASAQTEALWTDVAEPVRAADTRQIVPEVYRTLHLDRAAMRATLAEAPAEDVPGDLSGGITLALPMPDGSFAEYRVIESSIMAPGLQARYPELRSYLGQGITRPAETVRISDTPKGFHVLVLSPKGTVLIDPYAVGDDAHHIVYNKKDYVVDQARVLEAFGNEVVEAEVDPQGDEGSESRGGLQNGDMLRTYRLAMAATGEYSRFHSADASNPTVAEALAAIVVAMVRVNGIYERDVAVRMELIEETDKVIFLDPATDPYTNNSGSTMLNENRTTLNDIIGLDNYDVGHVFSTGGGGIAQLGSVCTTNKARGVTGLNSPIGDIFYVDFVSHEFGHQFRGNHSFNGSAGNCVQRNSSTAYEPGSGSTIMAYAGICGSHNLQSTSDDYFHNVSLNEIINFTTSGTGSTCGTAEETSNTAPTVEAEGGFTIPIETPFVLEGTGTDAESPESLTYGWEDYTRGPAGSPVTDTPPLFRSFDPVEEPIRYFPQLRRMLDGQSPRRGENLPAQDGVLRYRLTARDNAAGAGGVADVQISIIADEKAGPFEVTFPNEEDLAFGTGTELEVTWNVAGTDGGDVDTPTVDILYSDDDGETFLTILEGTENDGAATIIFPDAETEEGRLMIRGAGNVFFDVNDEPFTVAIGVATESQPGEVTYALGPVYPNPFGLQGATAARGTLNLSVENSEAVRVAVYDALGREVAVLHDGIMAAGQNRQFTLNAAGLAGGVYFVRAVGETFADVRSFTIVR